MTHRYETRILPLLLVLLLGSCSGVGPDVVDPNLSKRTEVALFAVNNDGGGDILRYSESQGSVVTQRDYQDANGSALGVEVDAIYSAYDSLFLVSRATGTITVLDLQTRKLLKQLSGFGVTNGGGLCGLAFSNRSQAWVVSYGTPSVYLIDAYNLSVLPEISLTGNPTAIGTSGTKVYVGMEMPDGSGGLSILSSNAGGAYTVEQTLPLASPPVFIGGAAGGTQAFVLTAGNPGADTAAPFDDAFPEVAILSTNSPVQILARVSLTFCPSLYRRIGKLPVWTSQVYQDYLYLALPIGVVKVDMISASIEEIGLPEEYEAVGADFFSSLVYAMLPDGKTVRRVDADLNILPDLTLPVEARGIRFVSSTRIR